MKNFIIAVFLFLHFLESKAGLRSIPLESDSDSEKNKRYYSILVIAGYLVIQLSLFYICKKNTERLRKQAQVLRAEIGAEYDKIKEEQFANLNERGPLNYYLVYPNDPRFKGTRTRNNR